LDLCSSLQSRSLTISCFSAISISLSILPLYLSIFLSPQLPCLSASDVSAFEALFTFAKPSFVNVGAPAFDAAHDVSLVAYRRHVRAFAAEIGERLQLNQLYHMLKLYSSVSIAKLARLVEPPTSEQARERWPQSEEYLVSCFHRIKTVMDFPRNFSSHTLHACQIVRCSFHLLSSFFRICFAHRLSKHSNLLVRRCCATAC
jgi:hypothetical protein